MPPGEPLAHVAQVDWAALRHARGPATDVPARLRALAGEDRETRRRARAALTASLCHQGARWPASAAAVPFLLGLAADPRVPDRDEVVRLLAHLAVGHDSIWLPDGVPAGRFRAAVARSRGEGHAHGRWALDAYDAVRSGVPLLRELLRDPSAGLRQAAASTLAWFPEERGAVVPELLAAEAGEGDPGAAAAALIAVGLLDDGTGEGLPAVLAARLADDRPAVRLAAAIALARVRRDDPPQAAADELLRWTAADPPRAAELPGRFPFWDPRWYAYRSLARLGGTARAPVVEALLRELGRTRGSAAFHLVAAVLQAAFPDGPVAPGTGLDELTDLQQRVVRALERQRPWRMGQAGSIERLLAAYRLPDLFQPAPFTTLRSGLRRLTRRAGGGADR